MSRSSKNDCTAASATALAAGSCVPDHRYRSLRRWPGQAGAVYGSFSFSRTDCNCQLPDRDIASIARALSGTPRCCSTSARALGDPKGLGIRASGGRVFPCPKFACIGCKSRSHIRPQEYNNIVPRCSLVVVRGHRAIGAQAAADRGEMCVPDSQLNTKTDRKFSLPRELLSKPPLESPASGGAPIFPPTLIWETSTNVQKRAVGRKFIPRLHDCESGRSGFASAPWRRCLAIHASRSTSL